MSPCSNMVLKWTLVTVQTMDIPLAYGGSLAHRHRHRYQLQQDHRPRHGSSWQPVSGPHHGLLISAYSTLMLSLQFHFPPQYHTPWLFPHLSIMSSIFSSLHTFIHYSGTYSRCVGVSLLTSMGQHGLGGCLCVYI